jgi:hypothetical protein
MTTATTADTATGVQHFRKIFATWWPLAASWILMSLELPALSAVIARLPNPDINLAAYGGIAFPLALIFESPIIMLLAASTALSKDYASYQRLRTYMMRAGLILTALHILVAFTPLYYIFVANIIGVPQEIVEPGRLGLMIMTPWSWSIAYRRFNQGVLIRTGHSKAVGVGTMVRLSANLIVLTIGYFVGSVPGIVVGTSAVISGVLSEALYAGLVVRPVLHNELRLEPVVEPALTWQVFWAFYFPLVMTSLLSLLANPIGSAALSRMPLALESLAIWTVITGLIFILRSLGIAYNEVVVALLDDCGAYPYLKHFAGLLAAAATVFLLVVTATPLSHLWFQGISALRPDLAELAQQALWFALPLPALSVLQSWYQGTILYDKRTNGITESVVIYLITSLVVLGAGVVAKKYTGLNIGILALTLSVATQTGWLWYRSRPVRQTLDKRDQEMKTYD